MSVHPLSIHKDFWHDGLRCVWNFGKISLILRADYLRWAFGVSPKRVGAGR